MIAALTRAPASAQVESPISILGHGVDVALGQGILFQMAFTFDPRPDVDQIDHIALTWEAAGRSVNLRVDPARHLFREEWGFNVVFPYAPANPAELPPPLSLVFYTWEVFLKDGARAALTDELFYADDRFAWRSAVAGGLTLYTYSPDLNALFLAQRLAPVYALLTEQSGIAPGFRVVIHEPGDNFCPPARAATPTDTPSLTASPTVAQTWTPTPEATPTPTPLPLPECDPEAVAQAYRDAGFIALLRPNAQLMWLETELSYRMAKATWREVWGAAEVPAWFEEGLAQLYEPSPHASAILLAQNAVRTNVDYGLDQLQTAPTSVEGRGRDPWYAQSVSLILYLVDVYDPDAPARVARAIPAHPTFDEALASATARDTAGHLARWRTWALSDAAERMTAWTPYNPPTPTPTLTRTPTLTITPRPTLTPSATPVPTRFGVPQMTPVRFTPTPTGTPRPPTNTPRPPNTPTPKVPGGGGGGGPCPGAVALLAPAGVIALARRRVRRQR